MNCLEMAKTVQSIFKDVSNAINNDSGTVGKLFDEIEKKLVVVEKKPQAFWLALAELLCNLICFVYQALKTLAEMESNEKSKCKQWMFYWFTITDFFPESINCILPIYWLLKCIFLFGFSLQAAMELQHCMKSFSNLAIVNLYLAALLVSKNSVHDGIKFFSSCGLSFVKFVKQITLLNRARYSAHFDTKLSSIAFFLVPKRHQREYHKREEGGTKEEQGIKQLQKYMENHTGYYAEMSDSKHQSVQDQSSTLYNKEFKIPIDYELNERVLQNLIIDCIDEDELIKSIKKKLKFVENTFEDKYDLDVKIEISATLMAEDFSENPKDKNNSDQNEDKNNEEAETA
ncbi:Receptor expression-enhancing protein 5, partial [Trichinella nativa]